MGLARQRCIRALRTSLVRSPKPWRYDFPLSATTSGLVSELSVLGLTRFRVSGLGLLGLGVLLIWLM